MTACRVDGCSEPKYRREALCREHALERMRQYHKENRQASIDRSKKFRKLNPDYRHQHYVDNRDRYYEQNREWREANLDYFCAAESRRRQARSVRMTKEDKDISLEYRKAIANDPCRYCGATGEHVDHMQPLSRGGTDHWYNLTMACATCNLRKNAKTVEEFLAAQQEEVRA